MVFKKKVICTLLSGAFVAAFAGASNAAVVYNTTLTSTPGIFGFLVPADDFALGTFGDVEIGLRARYRVQPITPSDPTGLYGPFASGTQTAFGPNPDRSDRAQWSYDFYIRTSNGALLSDFNFTLCADLDRGPAFLPQCANPLNPLTFGGTNPAGSTTEAANSEQLFFFGTPGNVAYDVNAGGLYDFSLSFATVAAPLVNLGEVDIRALVTGTAPEPGTLAILGLGLAGLGFSRRKKQA